MLAKRVNGKRKPNAADHYVAFLRGINVGGNKKISMAALKAALEAARFENVRTLLASGNVLFLSNSADLPELERRMEQAIARKFSMDVSVLIRTRTEIANLCAADPFRSIRVTPRTRLFVTFLGAKPVSTIKIPYTSPDRSYRIFRRTDGDLCSVLTLGDQWAKNLRQMDILEKEFGKRITTRSWGTIQKCLKGLAELDSA